MTGDEERNAAIVRRTLSTVCWLFALFNLALGALGWSAGLHAKLMLGHGAVLGLAGTMLHRPRRGAIGAVIAACATSILIAALDLQARNSQAACIDASFVPIAALLLYKSRRHA